MSVLTFKIDSSILSRIYLFILHFYIYLFVIGSIVFYIMLINVFNRNINFLYLVNIISCAINNKLNNGEI